MTAPTPAERTLNIANFLMVALLAVLNLVGMIAGLYFEGPDSGSAWAAAMGSWSVLAHVLVGLALLVYAVYILVLSVRSKKNYRIVSSIVGFVAVLAAALFGSGFLSVQDDTYTLAMGISATVALIAYAYALVRAHHVEGA